MQFWIWIFYELPLLWIANKIAEKFLKWLIGGVITLLLTQGKAASMKAGMNASFCALVNSRASNVMSAISWKQSKVLHGHKPKLTLEPTWENSNLSCPLCWHLRIHTLVFNDSVTLANGTSVPENFSAILHIAMKLLEKKW